MVLLGTKYINNLVKIGKPKNKNKICQLSVPSFVSSYFASWLSGVKNSGVFNEINIISKL